MSRVKAVVDRSIMVRFEHLEPGDIVHVTGTEDDPIIDKIMFDGHNYKLVYKFRPYRINETIWMDPTKGGCIFIHDLRNERAEFLAS